MPTPKAGYFTRDGTRVPSVTTIIGRFKDSGALLYWAWQQGREGRELYQQRDEAADVGTLVHTLVECDIKERPHPDIPPAIEGHVISAYSAWRDWWRGQSFTIIATEVQLVSELHRFGGTPDAIGCDADGKRVLLDWKTSNAVYVDHLLQLAAYRTLWEETHPDAPITGGMHLIRFAKENGDFAHHYYPDLSLAWEQFKLLRAAYDIDRLLRRRAA